MTKKGKQTSFQFVVPDLNFVIISSRNKEGLLTVECDASDWTIVLFKLFDSCKHSVIVKLNRAIVK